MVLDSAVVGLAGTSLGLKENILSREISWPRRGREAERLGRNRRNQCLGDGCTGSTVRSLCRSPDPTPDERFHN
jgi:hypothetical protein